MTKRDADRAALTELIEIAYYWGEIGERPLGPLYRAPNPNEYLAAPLAYGNNGAVQLEAWFEALRTWMEDGPQIGDGPMSLSDVRDAVRDFYVNLGKP
jgi:hypothetical protein